LLPVLLLQGRGRWLVGLVTGAVMTLWTYGFMDWFMAVVWPSPAISRWLGRL
jgi:hypothetical protein